MDYQTPQVSRRATGSAGEPLTELAGAVGSHFSTLVELQMQLAAEDLKTAARRLAPPIAMSAIAFAIMLASCPVLLVAVAELIVRYGRMERGFAYLLVAVVSLLVAGVLVAIAIPRFRRSLVSLERSKNEFITNLRSLSSMWSQEVRRPNTTASHNGKH
jgi:hypothetical protein